MVKVLTILIITLALNTTAFGQQSYADLAEDIVEQCTLSVLTNNLDKSLAVIVTLITRECDLELNNLCITIGNPCPDELKNQISHTALTNMLLDKYREEI